MADAGIDGTGELSAMGGGICRPVATAACGITAVPEEGGRMIVLHGASAA